MDNGNVDKFTFTMPTLVAHAVHDISYKSGSQVKGSYKTKKNVGAKTKTRGRVSRPRCPEGECPVTEIQGYANYKKKTKVRGGKNSRSKKSEISESEVRKSFDPEEYVRLQREQYERIFSRHEEENRSTSTPDKKKDKKKKIPKRKKSKNIKNIESSEPEIYERIYSPHEEKHSRINLSDEDDSKTNKSTKRKKFLKSKCSGKKKESNSPEPKKYKKRRSPEPKQKNKSSEPNKYKRSNSTEVRKSLPPDIFHQGPRASFNKNNNIQQTNNTTNKNKKSEPLKPLKDKKNQSPEPENLKKSKVSEVEKYKESKSKPKKYKKNEFFEPGKSFPSDISKSSEVEKYEESKSSVSEKYKISQSSELGEYLPSDTCKSSELEKYEESKSSVPENYKKIKPSKPEKDKKSKTSELEKHEVSIISSEPENYKKSKPSKPEKDKKSKTSGLEKHEVSIISSEPENYIKSKPSKPEKDKKSKTFELEKSEVNIICSEPEDNKKREPPKPDKYKESEPSELEKSEVIITCSEPEDYHKSKPSKPDKYKKSKTSGHEKLKPIIICSNSEEEANEKKKRKSKNRRKICSSTSKSSTKSSNSSTKSRSSRSSRKSRKPKSHSGRSSRKSRKPICHSCCSRKKHRKPKSQSSSTSNRSRKSRKPRNQSSRSSRKSRKSRSQSSSSSRKRRKPRNQSSSSSRKSRKPRSQSRRSSRKSRKSRSQSSSSSRKRRKPRSHSSSCSRKRRKPRNQSSSSSRKSRKPRSQSRRSSRKSRKSRSQSSSSSRKRRKPRSHSSSCSRKRRKPRNQSSRSSRKSSDRRSQSSSSSRKCRLSKRRESRKPKSRSSRSRKKYREPTIQLSSSIQLRSRERERPTRTSPEYRENPIACPPSQIKICPPEKQNLTKYLDIIVNPSQITKQNCNIKISGQNYRGTFNIGLDPEIDRIIYCTLKELNKCTVDLRDRSLDRKAACQRAEAIVMSCYKILDSLFKSSLMYDRSCFYDEAMNIELGPQYIIRSKDLDSRLRKQKSTVRPIIRNHAHSAHSRQKERRKRVSKPKKVSYTKSTDSEQGGGERFFSQEKSSEPLVSEEQHEEKIYKQKKVPHTKSTDSEDGGGKRFFSQEKSSESMVSEEQHEEKIYKQKKVSYPKPKEKVAKSTDSEGVCGPFNQEKSSYSEPTDSGEVYEERKSQEKSTRSETTDSEVTIKEKVSKQKKVSFSKPMDSKRKCKKRRSKQKKRNSKETKVFFSRCCQTMCPIKTVTYDVVLGAGDVATEAGSLAREAGSYLCRKLNDVYSKSNCVARLKAAIPKSEGGGFKKAKIRGYDRLRKLYKSPLIPGLKKKCRKFSRRRVSEHMWNRSSGHKCSCQVHGKSEIKVCERESCPERDLYLRGKKADITINLPQQVRVISPYKAQTVVKTKTNTGDNVAEVFLDNGQVISVTQEAKELNKCEEARPSVKKEARPSVKKEARPNVKKEVRLSEKKEVRSSDKKVVGLKLGCSCSENSLRAYFCHSDVKIPTMDNSNHGSKMGSICNQKCYGFSKCSEVLCLKSCTKNDNLATVFDDNSSKKVACEKKVFTSTTINRNQSDLFMNIKTTTFVTPGSVNKANNNEQKARANFKKFIQKNAVLPSKNLLSNGEENVSNATVKSTFIRNSIPHIDRVKLKANTKSDEVQAEVNTVIQHVGEKRYKKWADPNQLRFPISNNYTKDNTSYKTKDNQIKSNYALNKQTVTPIMETKQCNKTEIINSSNEVKQIECSQAKINGNLVIKNHKNLIFRSSIIAKNENNINYSEKHSKKALKKTNAETLVLFQTINSNKFCKDISQTFKTISSITSTFSTESSNSFKSNQMNTFITKSKSRVDNEYKSNRN